MTLKTDDLRIIETQELSNTEEVRKELFVNETAAITILNSRKTIENILDENRLNEVYSNDWNKTTACGKLQACTKTCGAPNVLDDTMSHEDNPYKKTRKATDHREHLS